MPIDAARVRLTLDTALNDLSVAVFVSRATTPSQAAVPFECLSG